MPDPDELKLYFDYKSPFAYLAMEPALDLPGRYAVRLRPLPFLLRIKGQGERCIDEGHEDHVFGVPIFVFRGEFYWGYDRMPLLEARLRECGLARAGAATTGGTG